MSIPKVLLASDTETTGLYPWLGDRPYLFSFCWTSDPDHPWYVEFPVDPLTREVLYHLNPKGLEMVKELLGNPGIPKLGHNFKFDIHQCENAGIPVRGECHDTMFMVHAIDSGGSTLALKPLCDRLELFDTSDQDEIHALTIKARRLNKRHNLGWANADIERTDMFGETKTKSQVPADYWMVSAIAKHNDGAICPSPRKWLRSASRYALIDAQRTVALWRVWLPILLRADGALAIYQENVALQPVTLAMERRGVRIAPRTNYTWTQKYIAQAKADRAVVEAAAKTIENFNIRSARHIGRLALDILKLPITATTKTGQISVSSKTLTPHIRHPVIHALFRYRGAYKAVGTFFDNFDRFAVLEPDGKGYAIHANFKQVGPVTHRYACSDPNMQNVANALGTRAVEPIQTRPPFGPRKGYVWYLLDWSQLEVRIFATIAKEKMMMDALLNDRDLHTECAEKAWGGKGNEAALITAMRVLQFEAPADAELEMVRVWEKEFGKTRQQMAILSWKARQRFARKWMEYHHWKICAAEKSLGKKMTRNRAKLVLFAKVFGGGPGAIADLMYCSLEEAAEFLRDYDRAMPGINKAIRRISEEAKQFGYVITELGHRITLRDLTKAYRAVNYRVQGTAAGMLKRAMRKCHEYLVRIDRDMHLIMPIHDEIVFEVPEDDQDLGVIANLRDIMEDNPEIPIPTPVDADLCVKYWHEKTPVELPRKVA